MFQQINIKNEIVEDIQRKDIERQTAENTLLNITNIHINDTDPAFLQSPVYKALNDDAVEKKKAWDNAKDKMIIECVSPDIRPKVKTWNLDYASCILTLEL